MGHPISFERERYGAERLGHPAHIHGNAMNPRPSTGPGNDDSAKFPNYVYSEKNGVPELYVTDPNTNGSVIGPLDMGQTGCPAAAPGFSQSPSESYT